MSGLLSMRIVASSLICAGFWLLAAETAQATDCSRMRPASFDVREDPFNLSAEERYRIIDVVHAFALTWDLRDRVNLPLLFIDGDQDDGFVFSVCNSAPGVTNAGDQIGAATDRQALMDYFNTGPFCYVEGGVVSGNNCVVNESGNNTSTDTTSQARHFISNIVVKSHQFGDVKVVADLLVTLQYVGNNTPADDPTFPVVDYTGMIEAVLTKEWGGVWKFRELFIFMDVAGDADSFRGR